MTDYDSPWKECLEEFFEAFVEFFFPQAHADIDWPRGVEFLDTELQQILRDADQGRRIVDKLARVWRKDGHEDWVLAHIEIQGDRAADFEERMFACHYRIFDKYQRRVATLVVLADENPRWRPSGFGYELWGCRVQFEFPTSKLLDLAADWAGLESHPNVFAVLVMAYLKAKETRRDPAARYTWKLKFLRNLYNHGWSRQQVLDVFHKIDWFLELPSELELRFREQLVQLESEGIMPYVTSIERLAKNEGRAEGQVEGQVEGLHEAIRVVLEERFGADGDKLADRIDSIMDPVPLKSLHRAAVRATSLDEFASALS